MAIAQSHGKRTWLFHPAPGRVKAHLDHLRDETGHFDLPEIERELRREVALEVEGHAAVTLAKYPDLRVVLIALRRGARRVEARTGARVSLQTLRGNLEVRLPGGVLDLPAGHLVTLEADVGFGIQALTDSALLLTLSWPGGEPRDRTEPEI